MRKIAMFLTAGAILASGVHADWLLNEYATVTADSQTTNALYGVQSFQNKASAVTIKVAAAGSISLIATTIASDADATNNGYTANIGMLHPLTPDWSVYDLTGLTSIDFEFKNSTEITDYFAVSFGSTAYSEEISLAGTVFEVGIRGAADLKASTAWKPASIRVGDFATPKWWTAIPADFPEIGAVLKEVKNLQFAPKTLYSASGKQTGTECSKCVTPTMTTQTLDIRKITLVGVPPNGISKFNPTYIGCTTVGLPLDVAFDDNKNEAGGYWFNFSDYDSLGTSTDKAKGKSTSSFTTVPGDEFASGSVTLHAGLNKVNGTTWNPYAGWAAIGTGFEGAGYMKGTGVLTGIKFHAQADSLPETIKFVNFKVGLMGVSDTATHLARLPAANLLTAAGDDFCAQPEDLKMPSYVAAAHKSAFDASKGIKQLAWEAKITDDKDPLIKTAQVKLTISNVQFFGITEFTMVGVDRKAIRSARPFGISYANGVLSLKGFQGVSSVDVLSIDGRKIASFAPQATMALDLTRGTYFVSAKRNGTSVVQSFAVIGR